MNVDLTEFPLLDQALVVPTEIVDSSNASDSDAFDEERDPSLPSYLPRDSNGLVDFSHHRRKCLVCNHAYRRVIEYDYLTWRDPASIAEACGFHDARPILRHAEALGLNQLRARRITSALERLIQQASRATPTASSIVNAIKLYAQMNHSWNPPPRRVVVTHVRRANPAAKQPASAPRGRAPRRPRNRRGR